MRNNKWSVAGWSAVATGVVGMNLITPAGAQQGVPAAAPKTGSGNSQPGTGSGSSQPGPTNSQPRSTNNPGTVQPQQVPNRPTTPPGQPATGNGQLPTIPGPNGQPVTVVPSGTVTGGSGVVSTGLGKYERPFAFQSPGVEARFTDSSRRLAAMETRMTLANQNLLKRLGEARLLPPDKQNAAMADIIQQMLLDQAQMQRYLAQARTAWTGELEPLPAEMAEQSTPVTTPADASNGQPVVPAQNPAQGQPPGQTPSQVPPATQAPVTPQNPPR